LSAPDAAAAPGSRLLGRLERLVARRLVRVLLAALSGAGLALAFPPADFMPGLIAFSVLLILIEAGEARTRHPLLERALLGAAFGFGAHLMGLWWIGAAFLVEADRYAALLPFAVIGLPLLLAPFMALATALVGLAPPTLAYRAIALALAVSGTEWLRGVVLTGFPWNSVGIALTPSTLLMQTASAVGLAGLAVPAVLLGALPAALCEHRSRWLAAVAGAVLAAMAAFGAYRLLTQPPTPADAPLVRVVQPSVPQHEKWAPEQRDTIWQRLLLLSDGEPGAAAPAAIIWPETAIPFLYRSPGEAASAVADLLGPDTVLVTGAAELVATEGAPRMFNTVLVLGPEGERLSRYDKERLVPFGEYVPLAGLLERIGLTALAAGDSSFAAGNAPVTLRVGALPPFQPLICYEVIFSGRGAAPPAAWIVNVTNDAWFGNTPGPRQHLRHAVLRAVERGVPVVRAANNGISAVIDSAGRIVERLPLNAVGAFDARLPVAFPSLHARFGDIPLFGLWLCGAIAMVVQKHRFARLTRDTTPH